jgi:hypothetical protein
LWFGGRISSVTFFAHYFSSVKSTMRTFFDASLAVGLTSLLAGASPAGATCDAIAGNLLWVLTGLGFAAV